MIPQSENIKEDLRTEKAQYQRNPSKMATIQMMMNQER